MLWIVGMRRLIPCLALPLFACQTPAPVTSDEDCEWIKPDGEPAQFTLAGQPVGGVKVAEPIVCKWGAQYIELRGSGTRQLVLASEMPKEGEKCTSAPIDPNACPKVQIDHFVASVWPKLSDANIYIIGAGRGPCGEDGPYDAWNFSINISDWAKADEAVRLVAAEMERWSIGNQVGVAVRSAYCAKPE